MNKLFEWKCHNRRVYNSWLLGVGSYYHKGETPDVPANSRGFWSEGFRVTFSAKKPSKAFLYHLDDI